MHFRSRSLVAARRRRRTLGRLKSWILDGYAVSNRLSDACLPFIWYSHMNNGILLCD